MAEISAAMESEGVRRRKKLGGQFWPSRRAARVVAQNAAAADLVDAVSRTSQRTVHRVLRHDLKNARELREQEADAERRIAAALGGKCSFVSLPDGSMNMRVTYKIGPRKEREEDVQDIPRPLLKVRVYARCILPQISFLLVLE